MTTPKYTRVCLYGGPGSGKSTTAHYLAYRLKHDRHEAEIAREWCKRAAYTNQTISQIRIFTEQVEEEKAALDTGATVICESPIWMQLAYAKDDLALRQRIEAWAERMDKAYPTLHVFLRRGSRQFVQTGRWHNEQESLLLDEEIGKIFEKIEGPKVALHTGMRDEIYASLMSGVDSLVHTMNGGVPVGKAYAFAGREAR